MKNPLIIVAILLFASGSQAQAEAPESAFQRYFERGQKAFDKQSFRSASTYWQKALKAAETDEQPNIVAKISTKLAESLAAQGNYRDADTHIHNALQLYSSLGGITPDFARVFANLSKNFRLVPPEQFGADGARTLNDNSARVSVRRLENATRVEVDAPARFVTDSGNDEVDQVAFDKLVTFDLKRDADGTLIMENIKGFRVHLAEKRLWVSLLNLVVKGQNTDGNRYAEITGGKAGITKTIQHRVPSDAVAPLDTLLKNASELDAPVVLSLPTLLDGEQ